MASVEINQMLAAAAEACDEKKAEDIRILALDPTESGLTDYFLICTGTNDRQTVAITDEIELRLKHDFGTYPNSVEGRKQGEWVLMDYVDFIVHVFLPEKRAYYGLERLRPSATTLSIADLNAEIKAAITAQRAGKAIRKTTSPSEQLEASPIPAKPKQSSNKQPSKRSAAPVKTATSKTGIKASAKRVAVKSAKATVKSVKRAGVNRRTAQPGPE